MDPLRFNPTLLSANPPPPSATLAASAQRIPPPPTPVVCSHPNMIDTLNVTKQPPVVASRIVSSRRKHTRPQKVESRILGPAEPQWMVDYAQARLKLDSMQTKMSKAIGVLRPYLLAKGHLSMALNELNQISTMDIMAVSLSTTGAEPQPTAERYFY